MAVERAAAGFQLGFHAIGDKAASMALDAFSQPGVSRTARNRIEHAQVVDPADIPRFKQLGVIASMQPNHLLTDMNWAVDRLGPERAAYSYAWKAFLDAGVPLAFGTDYPVEPITPFRGLYAAVTRMNEAGTKTYYPENKLTRGQALYAYTQGSAYAEFAEKHKGKLVPGYDADFILVDRDLYKVDAPAHPLHQGPPDLRRRPGRPRHPRSIVRQNDRLDSIHSLTTWSLQCPNRNETPSHCRLVRLFGRPLFFSRFVPATLTAQQPILTGVWRGESICVQQGTACNNEHVVYYIDAIPDHPDQVQIRADKIVNGKAITMGTESMAFRR